MKKNDFLGLTTLIVLALKRDRIRLIIWIFGIALLLGFMIGALGAMLETKQDIMNMAIAHGSNPAIRVFLGPISGVDLGGFLMFRISSLFAVIFGIFGFLTVTRHTRENEETGREELIGSTAVGRHGGLVAALIVAIGGNMLLAVLIALAFIVNGHPFLGSFAGGFALGAVGIVFAGIGAITAQLTETSRGANGIAGIIMGTFFLVSGVGNMLGEFNPTTVTITSHWLVWFSPFGWYQQIHSFYDNNWWILLLFFIFLLMTIQIALLLNQKRDVGMGILPARKGPAKASAYLLSPLGLAWRLQRKLLLVWVLAVFFFGAILGVSTTELAERMVDIERAAVLGDIFVSHEMFSRGLIALIGPFLVFYTVQAFLRMVAEETKGLTEAILATAVTHSRWILSHITCFFGGTLVVLLSLGLGSAASIFFETEIRFFKLLETALIQGPPIFLIAGLSIMVFGIAPQLSALTAWITLMISIIFGPFFGPALNLPLWVQNISPFTHTPTVGEKFNIVPPLLMLLLALFLIVLGIVSFSKRSMQTQ